LTIITQGASYSSVVSVGRASRTDGGGHERDNKVWGSTRRKKIRTGAHNAQLQRRAERLGDTDGTGEREAGKHTDSKNEGRKDREKGLTTHPEDGQINTHTQEQGEDK
jgi:hypothetical protein